MTHQGPSRGELATDPELLVAMGPAFDAALETGLAELGLSDTMAGSGAARRSYEAHARLLREWNVAINLTAIRDPADVARRHVCDALSAAPLLSGSVGRRASLLDVGSGGGYPGLPLAAALPLARVGLVDSVGKKARFLAVAGAAVAVALAQKSQTAPESRPTGDEEPRKLAYPPDEVFTWGDGGWDGPTIEVHAERAEDLADEPDMRENWDVVVVRAVGSLAEVMELCLPLTRPGGTVVAWKREEVPGGLEAELQKAGPIIRTAGGGRPRVEPVAATGLAGHRLVLVSKERATPLHYPRPPAVRRSSNGPGVSTGRQPAQRRPRCS
jgi:16S rRNA (guanine527-N7)-methyltransferase